MASRWRKSPRAIRTLRVHKKDLGSPIVGTILDGLLAHLVKESLTTHGPVYSGVVRDGRRDCQGADRGVLVNDHRLSCAEGGEIVGSAMPVTTVVHELRWWRWR